MINEGKVFKVGKVNIIGDLLGQSDYFKENLLLKLGDVFSNINLQNSLLIIQERLGDFGYAFARAFPVTKFKDDRTQ